MNSTSNQTTLNVQLPIDTWTIAQFCLYGVVFIIAIIGNGLVVLIVACNRSMHSPKNYFIVNLALSDLATPLFNVPITILGRFYSWQFGEFFCKYIYCMIDVVAGVSALTLISLTVDRYRIIVNPLSQQLTLCQVRAIISSIWVISYLAVGLPLSFGLRIGRGVHTEKACVLVWPSKHLQWFFYMERTVLLYIIPVVVTLVTYCLITSTINKNLAFVMRALSTEARVGRLKRQKHLTKMLFIICLAFAVCFLPIQVFTILVLCEVQEKWMLTLLYISIFLVVTHSCCNPIILCVMGHDFRNGFLKYLAPFLCLVVKPGKSVQRKLASYTASFRQRSQLDPQTTRTTITSTTQLAVFTDINTKTVSLSSIGESETAFNNTDNRTTSLSACSIGEKPKLHNETAATSEL